MLGRLTRGEEESGRSELLRSLPVGPHALSAAALITVAAMNVVTGALVIARTPRRRPSQPPVRSSFGIGVRVVRAALRRDHRSSPPRSPRTPAWSTASAAWCSVRRSCCGRSATSATGRSRGCHRSVGRKRCARTPATRGGRCSSSSARPHSSRGSRSPCRGGATSAPASSRRVAGRAHAAPSLGTPLGLATRLQRGSVIGWTSGLLVLAVAYGWITDSINEFVQDNKALTDIIAAQGHGSLAEQYVAMSFRILALITAGFAIQSALRPRSEETATHAEQVLATPVSRTRFASSHLAVAFGGTALILALEGVTFGVLAAVTTGDSAAIAQCDRRRPRVPSCGVADDRDHHRAVRPRAPRDRARVGIPCSLPRDRDVRAAPRPPAVGREPLAVPARPVVSRRPP